MTTIYYFIGVLFLIYEVFTLFNITESHRKLIEFKLFQSQNKDAKYDDYPEEIKKYMISKLIIVLPLLIWLFTGLLTSQWYLFLALLIIDFGLFNLFRKITGTSVYRLYLYIVVQVTYITFILFILLNKFHLHLSLEEFLYLIK